ncbi:MAG: pelA [Holophagaceae bacterium]|nr:pelA [Holophagaceae bacterium]
MKFENEAPPYPCYSPTQSCQIAGNILLWQNPDGGWPKNKDWFRVLGAAERFSIATGRKAKANLSTLDNGGTWTQLAYLAQVRRHTGSRAYDPALRRGVDYLLSAQRASGGWVGSDVDAITFNDGVMVGVLGLLRQVAEDPMLQDVAGPQVLTQVRMAYARGLGCILRCQVRVDGRLTGWAQQNDHGTLLPVWGRRFEPPVLATRETTEVVAFLMEQKPASPEVEQALRGALAWLASVKLEGCRLVSFPAEPVAYPFHTSRTDYRLVKEPGAPPLWARYYDPVTHEPVFCSRDGVLLERYEDLTRERRTGYEWFGDWPSRVLKEHLLQREVHP